MTFGDFIRAVHTGIPSLNLYSLTAALFHAANSGIIIKPTTAKNWLKSNGKYLSYQKLFINRDPDLRIDRESDIVSIYKNFDDNTFLDYLKKQAGKLWKTMQSSFALLDRDESDEIKCDTNNEVDFYKSVLLQFKLIIKYPYNKNDEPSALSSTFQLYKDLAIMERRDPFDEIWVVGHDFSIDVSNNTSAKLTNPYYGVLKHNLKRKIKYKYFVPEAINKNDIEDAYRHFEYDNNFTIYACLPKTFIPDLGLTIYEPNKTKDEGRKCTVGVWVEGFGGTRTPYAIFMPDDELTHLISELTRYMKLHSSRCEDDTDAQANP